MSILIIMKNKKLFLMVLILCSSTFLSPKVLATGTDEDHYQLSVFLVWELSNEI